MNKIIIGFLFAISTTALASTDVEITLRTVTNLKVVQSHKIKLVGQKLYLDEEEVDPVQWPRAAQSLSPLLNAKSEPKGACPSGTYTHIVRKGKKKETATGCLGSPRSEVLLQSLGRIQKLFIIKK